MDWLKRKRIKQVLQFGWRDSKDISVESGKSRFQIWCDILKCFKTYYLFSHQYKSNCFWSLNAEERNQLANKLGSKNRYRDEWTVWKYENAAFINKYSSIRYGSEPNLYKERLIAYMDRYNIGKGSKVSNGVVIERNHYLEGSISIGNNVVLSKNVYLDYSGELIIHDNVIIANGVIIETHHRDMDAYIQGKDINIPTKLEIAEGVFLGARSIVLDSCNYIGKFARIGAGAVVTKDIPDYAVAVGVPAKVVKYLEH